MKLEDQYLDVLQNIEAGIVATWRDHPAMSDYDVMRTLEAVMDSYVAGQIGRAPGDFLLSDVERTLMENVRMVCDWRLGRADAPGLSEKEENPRPKPKTVDEILLCLKRILKSVKSWNKDGGRQGYLNFIVQYMP